MEDGRNPKTSAEGGSPKGGSPKGESKIGRMLEQARRDRGLSLEEVEHATKIRKRYLMGLEREDYAMLPDAVYARGFLKTYANFLGLDGEAFSQHLRSRRKPRRDRGIRYSKPENDFGRPLITPGGVSGTQKRKFPTSAVLTLLAAILTLAVVIGTLYFVGRGVLLTQARESPPAASADKAPDSPSQNSRDQNSRDQTDDASTGDGPSERGFSQGRADEPELVTRTGAATDGRPPTGQPGGGTTVADQSAPPDVLLVSVTVGERPSWLLIRADGALAYEETAAPGFTQTFEADRQISITSGDAGAVTVEVNGQEAGALGTAGDVVTRNFTLKSAS